MKKLRIYFANQWSSDDRFIYVWPTAFIMRGKTLNGFCISWLWFTVGITND